jgi:hypothetical protein
MVVQAVSGQETKPSAEQQFADALLTGDATKFKKELKLENLRKNLKGFVIFNWPNEPWASEVSSRQKIDIADLRAKLKADAQKLMPFLKPAGTAASGAVEWASRLDGDVNTFTDDEAAALVGVASFVVLNSPDITSLLAEAKNPNIAGKMSLGRIK